jgi:histidinol-phosphate aminotransferase
MASPHGAPATRGGSPSCTRCGYALGDVGLIEALRRVKDSFNSYPLGRVAQAGATASARDEAYFRESCARVVAGLEQIGSGRGVRWRAIHTA